MPFPVLFHGVTCSLVLIGIVGVTLAEQAYVYLLFLGALIFISWKRDVAGRPSLLSRNAASLMSLAAMLFLAADYWLFQSNALRSLAHFLMLMQVIKLYSHKFHRDYVLLYVICLVQLGLTSLMVFQLDFMLLFFCYCVLGSWGLVLFHINSEYENCKKTDPLFQPPPVSLRIGLVGILLSVVVLIGTGAVFAVIPRFGNGYLRYPSLANRPVTGLGDAIDFNLRGEIFESQQVVMRVKIEGPGAPGSMLFRGKVLDRYENNRWTASPPRKGPPRRLNPDRNNLFVLSRPRHESLPLIQTYYLQPSASRMLFFVQKPHQLRVLTGLSNPVLIRGPEQTLEALGYRGKQIVYQVESQQPRVDPRHRVSARAFSPHSHRRYTQLPDNFPRAKFRKLALQINRVASVRNDHQRVIAVRDYLRRIGGFRYSLENRGGGGKEPIEQFLFVRKSGHCEYFAGAMAVLLRSQGIACRVVTGYLGAEFNPVGQYYLVRQKHAHAWVEVLFQRVGWVPFDPTPADVAPPPPEGLASRMREMIDYARLVWITQVVSYDFYDQQSLYFQLKRKSTGALRDLKLIPAELGAPDSPDAAPPMAGLFGALGGLVGLWLLRGRWQRRQRRRARRALSPQSHYMLSLEQVLRRHGLDRQGGETHLELALRAESAGLPAVGEFVRCYSAFRYRGDRPATEDIRQLKRWLVELRRFKP